MLWSANLIILLGNFHSCLLEVTDEGLCW